MEGTPTGTRLILASENLLDVWGTRTELGERITVQWGEPEPEGWYLPTFTVHQEGKLPDLSETRRLRAIEAAARERERAEEVYADAETAYNESSRPEFTRRFLQLDRLENERDIAIAALRSALRGRTDAD